MLTVTLLLVLVSPPEAAPTPEQAKSLYGEGRYVEAARMFEALWRDDPQPKFLYNAGAAWEAAGEDVGALAGFVGYLTEKTRRRDLGAEDRQAVEARVERLEGRLVPVVVEISPTALRGRVRVAVTRDPGGERFEVTPRGRDIATAAVEERIYLSPGAWRLQLVVPGEASQYYVHNSGGEDALVYVPLPAEEAAAPQASLRVKRLEGEVELRVAPALDPRGLEASFVDVLGIEPVVVARMSSSTLRLKLRSGPWRFVISRRRRGIVRSGEVAVVAGEVATVAVGDVGGAAPKRGRHHGRRGDELRRKIVLSEALGGGILLVTGFAVVAVKQEEFEDHRRPFGGVPDAGLAKSVVDETPTLTAGASVGGAGLGLWISSAWLASGGGRLGAVLVWAGAGLSVVGGAVGVGFFAEKIGAHQWNWDPRDVGVAPLSPLAELRWRAAVSGAALGLGVGMAVGSTLGWTVLRLKRDAQVRVSPKFGTRFSGLMMEARF